MVNLFLFLALMFLLTFLLGRAIEKIRVPWIFAALLIGAFLAIHNPFSEITSSQAFILLAQLGMYFLLFIIGFEIDLKELKTHSKFIVKATLFIILFEALFGGLLIRFVFHYSWFISFLVSLSFATVGEAILVPILDEFGIINTKLGQSIIGIGTLDDIFEIFTLILVSLLVGSSFKTQFSIHAILFSLFMLFLLTVVFTKFKKYGKKFAFFSIETLLLFALFVLFLFLGIGNLAEASPLAALLAGISLKTFMPKQRVELIKNEVKAICYGFFAPIFFLWVGASLDMHYLLTFPLLIILVVVVSKGAKLLASFIVARRELTPRQSLLLGISLSVRFSTSIIIIKILYDYGLVASDLYSIIVASSIVFKFVVPVLFSNLLVRWGVAKAKFVKKSK